MEKLSIKEIAEAVNGSLEGKDGEVFSVSTDTRKIEKNSLFIAVKGENFDAHDFAEDAAKQGAVCVMAERKVECSCSVIYVKSTRIAQLLLAGYYRRKFNIPVVGVTGSVGKTTTKEMISTVLNQKYNTLKTEGNFNNDIGLPRMIFRLDGSYSAAVLEMGMSHSGEITYLTKAAQPTAGVISNIGISHIENLGSQENILKAKLEILNGMKADAPLVLNGDDKFLQTVKSETRKIYFYGINNKNCDFYADNIVADGEFTRFDIVRNRKKYPVNLHAIGIHNVYNALAAFAVGEICGVEEEKRCFALENYVACGMRQKVVRANGIVFIEDCYNASPDSQKASLNALVSFKTKRHIAVLGDMLELGDYSEKAHRDVGEYAAQKGIDLLLLFGNQAKFMLEGAKSKGFENVIHFEDKNMLGQYLLENLKDGDAVSFKASRGMKFEEIIKYIYEGMKIDEK